MFAKIAAGTIFLAALAFASPSLARGEFTSGNWEGSAFFDGRTFSHCAMLASYKTGWDVMFSIDADYVVNLGFQHDDLTLKKGDEADFVMQVDNSPKITRTFTALSRTMFATEFTDRKGWFQALQRGLYLKLDVGDHVESFSLAGTNAALDRLLKCVDTYG